MDDADLLAAFDRQLRQRLVPPERGWVTERVGPVVRSTAPPGPDGGSIVEWSDLDEATADAEIAAQVEHFRGLGAGFEWKVYGHDRPADLSDRLLASGFVAEGEESLVVGRTDDVLAACAAAGPAADVLVRAVTPDDWAGVAAVADEVWAGRGEATVRRLARELAHGSDPLDVAVAEVPGGLVVGVAWVRRHPGTDFASLWGGSVLPAWRHRGVYRALVAWRAVLARRDGFTHLQVDAAPTSRPILQRLGLRVLTTTRPYVWSPP